MDSTGLRTILKQYWGYDVFRPLQQEAMNCVMGMQDSVVVLPTGGGKSLCYQVPAMAMPGLAIVVSPLISLMKDQVDALREYGVPAAFLNSSLTAVEREHVSADVRAGRLKLLYVAPERLVNETFLALLRHSKLSFFAVDEAHCISLWGHDFRPEYRSLSLLKESFPEISVHAYTATATPAVRDDIAHQLRLKSPRVFVGDVDRPNLIYRVLRRQDPRRQIRSVIDRHRSESGIIYCIRRADVEKLCADLQGHGYRALPYHAGMEDTLRKKNQEAFIQERTDMIVSTIAFGMGIDKPNVRFVIHAGMPKSIEHYQQESGRAGRDGLEAECCLFYAGADLMIWKHFLKDMESEAATIAKRKLEEMYGYCLGATCRHRTLASYFGQELPRADCGACDICLSEGDVAPDALVTAQKILSCVVRVGERFGIAYVARVLRGSADQRLEMNGHTSLSTYGLLAHVPRSALRVWIEQLVAQDHLRCVGEYRVLEVTERGRRVLRGLEVPRLTTMADHDASPRRDSPRSASSWDGVDRELFNRLRTLRSSLATARNVPAYVVLHDETLRELARHKPQTLRDFLHIKGIGPRKAEEFANDFLEVIRLFVREGQERGRD